MEIGPIWRALMRNKTAYVLIALQIAVTMAIMVNAVAIVQERNRLMARPSGIDEPNIFHLESVSFTADFDQAAAIREDLDAIRSMPGVVDAIATNSVPLRNGGWSSGTATRSCSPGPMPRSPSKRAGPVPAARRGIVHRR